MKVPTIKAALHALELHCGFPESRSAAIARVLQGAGLLPIGDTHEPPQINHAEFVVLFLALAADIDTPLRAAPDNARRFGAMSPGGAAVAADQDRISTTAAEYIECCVLDALDDEVVDLVRGSQFEIVSTAPELAHYIHRARTYRYQPSGAIPEHRPSTRMWKAVTIPGRAFVNTVRHLFIGEVI